MDVLEKRYFVSLLLLATLVLVGSYAMLTPRANATGFRVDADSRQDNGATVNLGTITVAGLQKNLPNAWTLVGDASWSLVYTPAPGYYFVRWQTVGPIVIANPNAASTTFTLTGDGWITAIYSTTPPRASVGGVITSTNPLITLAPHLALIGLVATTGIAVTIK